MCTYCVRPGMQMHGWIHQHHLHPVVELTDDDGLVAGNVVSPPQRDA